MQVNYLFIPEQKCVVKLRERDKTFERERERERMQNNDGKYGDCCLRTALYVINIKENDNLKF